MSCCSLKSLAKKKKVYFDQAHFGFLICQSVRTKSPYIPSSVDDYKPLLIDRQPCEGAMVEVEVEPDLRGQLQRSREEVSDNVAVTHDDISGVDHSVDLDSFAAVDCAVDVLTERRLDPAAFLEEDVWGRIPFS